MSGDLADGVLGQECLAMLAALVDGDVILGHRLTTNLLAQGVSFDEIVVNVLGPVQTELGARWARGDLGVADEHASSAVVEELLVRLGTVAAAPTRPAVVVATPHLDVHALGARVAASAFALEGYRVLFLGASVPPADLGDYLEFQEPLALALSCSTAASLVEAAAAAGVAHRVNVPVIGGGRAVALQSRAVRLGIDAFAPAPADAVAILEAWEASPPSELVTAPAPIPEHAALIRRAGRLIADALETVTDDSSAVRLSDELVRMLRVTESALLVDEPDLVGLHLRWLRTTMPEHGLPVTILERALTELADSMDADLERAGALIRSALN